MGLQRKVIENGRQSEGIPLLGLLRNRLLNCEPSDAENLADAGTASLVNVPSDNDNNQEVGKNGMANSESEISQSVAKVFEPTKGWREHSAVELASSLESLERIQHMATVALEPVRAFCEHMRRLDDGFRPLHTFETQIGELAESFPPMKAFHRAIANIVEESSTSFVQLAESLEFVNESRKQVARLTSTLEGAAELQTELNKLAQAFSKPSLIEVTTVPHAA